MADEFTQSVFTPHPETGVTTGENAVHDPWPRVMPEAPWQLLHDKFDRTMVMADDMLVRLVGDDGESGYLGALNSVISKYSAPVLDDIVVTVNTTTTSVQSRPVSDVLDELDTDFGTFDESAPVMLPLPPVDSAMAIPGAAPEAPTGMTINWDEIALPPELYEALMARIMADLAAGSRGVDPLVEQEIYDRALARQLTVNDKMVRDVEDYFAARGWDQPQGALAGRLAEAAAEVGRNNTEINGKIMIEQADLAQKNSHFVLQQAVALEQMIRASRDAESNRKLDYAKSLPDLVLRLYAEGVRAYLADAEAKKVYVQSQVEVLRGAIEANRGLVDVYRSKGEVFKIGVEAKASANQGIIEGFKAENVGYEAETRAISANQAAANEDNKIQIAKADLELRKQISIIGAAIQGYVSESSLKERVCSDMAQIATQSIAAALNAVNANASIGYSGSESRSESFGHSESISESHSFSAGISESHNYEHDPTT